MLRAINRFVRRHRLPAASRRALLAALGVAAFWTCAIPDPPDAVWVRIPDRASVEAVAETLAVHGIVSSAEQFADFARMGRKHLGIKSGVYPLRPGTPMGRVLVALRKGRPPTQRVTVRERMTLVELAGEVEAALGIPVPELLLAARDSALRTRIGARHATVEGYLYPTSYYVNLDATAPEVVRQMVDTFALRWNREWDRRLDTLGLMRDELVTLASIVAGEMPFEDERFEIASVYHNRLARGMRLQADPTIVYALGERRRLTFTDYGIESAYNTYRINGLPPGPIGQPSTESLEAALYPAETDYLYFVAGAGGRHQFSRSYREHIQTIRRVRGQ